MNSRGGRIAIALGVGSALVPLLLFAYIGLHHRLLVDDYGHLGLARDLGAWRAMAVWREIWNGDYSNFLLYGVLARLGTAAPPLFSLFLCASALAGFGWLINSVLADLRIRAHRHAIALALAALATAATIQSFYHAQSFYWLTVAVEYSFPAVMLLFGIALAVEAARRLRGAVHHALAGAAAAFYAFVNAGFSEMYLVFQLTAVALITIFVLLFQRGRQRKSYVTLAIAGLLGSLASLPAQLTTAGVAFRSSRTSVFDKFLVGPVRDLPDLIDRTLYEVLYYAGRETSFASFMLVLSAGLLLAASVKSRPSARADLDSINRKPADPRAPVAFALIAQLLFVPILWTHQSDSLQVMSRFSYAYALVAGVNLLGISSLLMLLWQRERFEALVNRRNGLMSYCACILLCVCLAFALTQVRNVHFKASSYLFVTAVSLLLMLGGQLARRVDEPGLRALFRLSAFAIAGAATTLGALIAVSLWGLGVILPRVLTAAAFALMLAGLLNGVLLGALIRLAFDATIAEALWLRGMRLGSLLVALTIAAGIVIGQGQRLEHSRRDAEIWDATHQEIIRLRDEGDPAVYTKLFPRLAYDEFGSGRSNFEYGPVGWRQLIWYGLLADGAVHHNCICADETMAPGDEAKFCAKLNCLAYGTSAGAERAGSNDARLDEAETAE